jgi:hypothetical protein
MFNLPESAICYADSAHGVYIPQYFAESIKRECVTGIDLADLDQLALGPDSCEWYCDIWNDVESRAIVTDPKSGIVYRLYQDGDLWLVPADWTPEDY